MSDLRYGNPTGTVGEEVATVRAIYAAFARRDVEGALAHIDPEAILHLRGTGDIAGRPGPYVGHQGVRAYFADADRIWAELTLQADDIRVAGEGVVVFGRVVGRSEHAVLDSAVVWTWRVRHGRAVSVVANVLPG